MSSHFPLIVHRCDGFIAARPCYVPVRSIMGGNGCRQYFFAAHRKRKTRLVQADSRHRSDRRRRNGSSRDFYLYGCRLCSVDSRDRNGCFAGFVSFYKSVGADRRNIRFTARPRHILIRRIIRCYYGCQTFYIVHFQVLISFPNGNALYGCVFVFVWLYSYFDRSFGKTAIPIVRPCRDSRFPYSLCYQIARRSYCCD